VFEKVAEGKRVRPRGWNWRGLLEEKWSETEGIAGRWSLVRTSWRKGG
jgi:hypothetical protein